MNVIEIEISILLSGNGDIAAEILQMIEERRTNDNITLCPQIQNELMNRLAGNRFEEDVWDRLLSIMSPNELSEGLLNYLIQNQISLLRLCHLPLQDKWLMKLIDYDDAPLYTLAKRFYLSDQYSPLEFLQFYKQYLHSKNDISLHLLDVYRNAVKRRLLLFLCLNDKEFEDKEKLQWYQIADQVRGVSNSKDITCIYKEYLNVGIVMTEIASNYFTSEEILLELSSAKGIQHASEIRKLSKNTLRLKRIAELKPQ